MFRLFVLAKSAAREKRGTSSATPLFYIKSQRGYRYDQEKLICIFFAGIQMKTTRLSSKGQIIIPQSIRMSYKWESGLEFAVIEIDNGILLTPIKPFKSTSIKDVLGCTGYKGSKKTIKDMEKGIAKGHEIQALRRSSLF